MSDKKKKDDYISTNSQVVLATMRPYISGAKIQLERYLESQRIMKAHKIGLGGGLDKCIYELSALLEHLDSIEVQLRNRHIALSTGEVIRQFRNHLRHDGRGDDDHSRGKRGQAIGLNGKLLVEIGFTDSGIKMGSTELTARQIDAYITTAEMIMWAILLGCELEIDGDEVKINQQPTVTATKNSPEA